VKAALDRWAPWFAGLVVLVGVASYAASRLVPNDASPSSPSQPAEPGAEIPLDPAARVVAGEFVAAAVARRDLDRAWRLAAPSLRGSLTLARWRSGGIPVVRYPVAQARVSYAVKSSRRDRALLQVTFLPRKASQARPAQFLIGLRRAGGRWLVTSWSSVSTIVPSPSG
jgi:hypothetical protein